MIQIGLLVALVVPALCQTKRAGDAFRSHLCACNCGPMWTHVDPQPMHLSYRPAGYSCQMLRGRQRTLTATRHPQINLPASKRMCCPRSRPDWAVARLLPLLHSGCRP